MGGLFASKSYSYSASVTPDVGLFMSGTRGSLFATQLVAVLVEIPWVVIMSVILFSALKMAGILRVKAEEEIAGLDDSKHGGSAYPVPTPVSVRAWPRAAALRD